MSDEAKWKFGEPWTIRDLLGDGTSYDVVDSSGASMGLGGIFNPAIDDPEDRPDFEATKERHSRIVACVNFCRSVSTEYLSSRVIDYTAPTSASTGILKVRDA